VHQHINAYAIFRKLNAHREYSIVTIWNIDIKNDGDQTSHVKRRFSHFDWLRAKLVEKYPYHAIPCLPEKNYLEKFYNDESEQIKERMIKLQHFLTILTCHPFLHNTQEVKDFLVDKDEAHFDYTFEEEKEQPKMVTEIAKDTFWSLADKIYATLPTLGKKK